MRTKIIHYGTDDETYILPGTYDSHTDEIGQGVYKKEEMMRFISIVTKHFLTDKQRQYYFLCVVYGESPMKIAKQEGVHISNVYKHLKKAKLTISNIKELMAYAGGKKKVLLSFFSKSLVTSEEKKNQSPLTFTSMG